MTDDAHGLTKVAAGDGQHFAVAGATLTWKVRSSQSGGAFSFFEQTLEPGEGVPLHVHGYPEAFYVLSGSLIFSSGNDPEQVEHCRTGDVILASPGTKHSFYNPGPDQVRMLSISSGAHEIFFDAVEAADRAAPFGALPPDQAMTRVVAIGAQTGTHFSIPSNS